MKSAPTSLRRCLLVLGALALGGGCFAAGRILAAGDGRSSERTGGAADSDLLLSSASGRADAGGIFRNRFALSSPEDGVEALLLTSRPRGEECVSRCPLALRIIDERDGAEATRRVFDSLAPGLDDLGTAAARDSEFVEALRRLRLRLARDGGEGYLSAPRRVLFVAAPRPDIGEGLFSAALVMYDHYDPFFDAALPMDRRAPGMRLTIVRVERRRQGDPRADLVEGDICVHDEVAPESPVKPPPSGESTVALLRGAVEGHFQAAPSRQWGLYLSPDGDVSRYGPDRNLVPFGRDDALVRAVKALLKRP